MVNLHLHLHEGVSQQTFSKEGFHLHQTANYRRHLKTAAYYDPKDALGLLHWMAMSRDSYHLLNQPFSMKTSNKGFWQPLCFEQFMWSLIITLGAQTRSSSETCWKGTWGSLDCAPCLIRSTFWQCWARVIAVHEEQIEFLPPVLLCYAACSLPSVLFHVGNFPLQF